MSSIHLVLLRIIHNFQCIAETYSFETKRQDHFRSKIESEKTFATYPADTEQTSNKGKITNRKTSFFMGPQRNYLLYGAFNLILLDVSSQFLLLTCVCIQDKIVFHV